MLADSARPDPTGNDQQGSAGKASEQGELRRATSLLRLLKSTDDAPFQDEELKYELQRLNRLLERIEQLAEQEEQRAEASSIEDDVDDSDEPAPEHVESHHEPEVDPALSAFDPLEFEHPDVPHPTQESQETPDQPDDFVEEPAPDGDVQDENLTRWWVNFNGDISLDRLARLRAHLSESPFTLETKFEEITDGLIVLRVVTDINVSMNQVDWILRQLMDLVGLDRNAAIVSRQ